MSDDEVICDGCGEPFGECDCVACTNCDDMHPADDMHGVKERPTGGLYCETCVEDLHLTPEE